MFLRRNITPRLVCLYIILACAFPLGAALIGQYMFGLHPCELCIYQRWPFGVAIVLGAIGYVSPRMRIYAIIGTTGLMVINAAIALFHTGVERKWWAGLEGCSTPDMSGSIEELMARIQNTAVTRCDEIAWQFMGLSMANYNVIYCAVFAALLALYLVRGRSASRL